MAESKTQPLNSQKEEKSKRVRTKRNQSTEKKDGSKSISQRAKAKREKANNTQDGTNQENKKIDDNTKKKSDQTNAEKKDNTQNTGFFTKEMILGFHALFACLLFIANLRFAGLIGDFLRNVQMVFFGVLGYIFPFIYFGIIMCTLSTTKKVNNKNIAIISAMVSLCTIVFLFSGEESVSWNGFIELYDRASGGGVIGGVFGSITRGLIGTVGAYILYVIILIASILYMVERSLIDGLGEIFHGVVVAAMRFKEELLAQEDEEEYDTVNIKPTRTLKNRRWQEEIENTKYQYEEKRNIDRRSLDRRDANRKNMDGRYPEKMGYKPRTENLSPMSRNRRKRVSGIDFGSMDLRAGQSHKKEVSNTESKKPLFGKSSGKIPFSMTLSSAGVHRKTGAIDTKESEIRTGEYDGVGKLAAVEETVPFDTTESPSGTKKVQKYEYSTPEESVRTYQADVFAGSIVKPYDYNRQKPFGEEEDTLDEATIQRVKEILARRGEIKLEESPPFEEDILEEKEIIESDLSKPPQKEEIVVPNPNEPISKNIYEDYDDYMDEIYDFGEPRYDNTYEGYEERGESEYEGYEEIKKIIKRERAKEKGVEEKKIEEIEQDRFVERMDEEIIEKQTLVFDSGDIRNRKNTSSINIDSYHSNNNDKEKKSENIKVKNTRKSRRKSGILPYHFPPTILLKNDPNAKTFPEEVYQEVATRLQQTLHNFGVEVAVTHISCGPVVTRYELTPEQGVKVSKIVGLSDDIKLSLAARDIRIEAPIPGKSAVGIEVPNSESNIVYFRDLIETEDFKGEKHKLAFAMGKDIAGKPVITDIASMPHLLIAGATGSGKSVCINTIIMSILYRYSPNDVKLIMIDPKVVELSIYNGVPHLLIPVVTEAKKAAGALNWAVAEMNDRYKKFAKYNVRDLHGYNKKIEQIEAENVEGLPEKLPKIIIIIDELADLMMVAQNEVEAAICRLAQLARACGIHLVIATQRPSVNVITGLIKANIPTRIAFAVSSGVDSRTILDGVGAERLLGKGDMLYSPQGSAKPVRIQGAFISDQEVQDVVEYIAKQGYDIQYNESTIQNIENTISSVNPSINISDERDELFASAGRFIIKKNKASKGYLQREFKIGFNRSARIMDQLFEAGVVGDDQGTKPREILVNAEQFEEILRNL